MSDNEEDYEIEDEVPDEEEEDDDEEDEDIDITLPTATYNVEQQTKFYVTLKDRVTSDYLSETEYVQIIAQRSKEISESGMSLSTISTNDPIKLAEDEVKKHLCPYDIIRFIGYSNNGDVIVERIPVNDLIVLM